MQDITEMHAQIISYQLEELSVNIFPEKYAYYSVSSADHL